MKNLKFIILLSTIFVCHSYAQNVEMKLGGTWEECFKVVNAAGEVLFFIQADGTIGQQDNAKIVGNFLYSNGSEGAGKYLTCDANGNATWTNPPALSPITINQASNLQPYTVVNFIIALQGMYPSRNSIADPTLAEIAMFAGNFAPRDWAFCNGQLLAISSHYALYSLIGTTYGGDGRTTFALPDLRGRVPMHNGNGPGLTPTRLGQKGGAETHTHTYNQ